MLAAAVALGRPVVPVFILDPETEALGAAAKWRLGLAVAAFARRWKGWGCGWCCGAVRRWRCCAGWWLRPGRAGSGGRGYMIRPRSRGIRQVKAALKDEGLEARSFAGHLLHEPWEVETGQGGFYRVFTPFWKPMRGMPVPAPSACAETVCAGWSAGRQATAGGLAAGRGDEPGGGGRGAVSGGGRSGGAGGCGFLAGPVEAMPSGAIFRRMRPRACPRT
jgi:deoxyribodipyrimidine photo-lyase